MKEDKRFEEITVNRGGWNDVEMGELTSVVSRVNLS